MIRTEGGTYNIAREGGTYCEGDGNLRRGDLEPLNIPWYLFLALVCRSQSYRTRIRIRLKLRNPSQKSWFSPWKQQNQDQKVPETPRKSQNPPSPICFWLLFADHKATEPESESNRNYVTPLKSSGSQLESKRTRITKSQILDFQMSISRQSEPYI